MGITREKENRGDFGSDRYLTHGPQVDPFHWAIGYHAYGFHPDLL